MTKLSTTQFRRNLKKRSWKCYGMIGPAMDGLRGERTNGNCMRTLPNEEIQSHLLCMNPVQINIASGYFLGGFLALSEG